MPNRDLQDPVIVTTQPLQLLWASASKAVPGYFSDLCVQNTLEVLFNGDIGMPFRSVPRAEVPFLFYP